MHAVTFMRIGLLALGSLVCAFVSGLAALYVQGATLPRTDLAYGISVFQQLEDPFVLGVWLSLTLLAGLIGFVFSLWALWNVQLFKALPLTFAVSVVVAAIAAGVFAPLSPVVALLSAVLVMGWCRYHADWALPGNPETSARQGAV